MLFSLAHSLGSLTRSPVQTTIDQAHRMAQRHLKAGGATDSARGRVHDHSDASDFVLPADIDAEEVRKAIEAKLRDVIKQIRARRMRRK